MRFLGDQGGYGEGGLDPLHLRLARARAGKPCRWF